jgi:hypothetical protein
MARRITSVESLWLGRYLEGRTEVRTLLSHIITHAELNPKHDLQEVRQLVDFFASLLRQ